MAEWEEIAKEGLRATKKVREARDKAEACLSHLASITRIACNELVKVGKYRNITECHIELVKEVEKR